MKKLFSLLLAIMLVCTLIPISAAAAFSMGDYVVIVSKGDRWIGYKSKDITGTGTDVTNDFNKYLASLKNDQGDVIVHGPKDHKFNGYGCNTKYHWLQCACGCKINTEPHVDPLNTANDTCICGYHFSDNAQLVTLWLDGCKGLKNFRKDVYEYETDAYTYKEVNEIKRIATRTHDSEATVEIPKDLTLKEGENKFEIKVTAENKKVSQVYTVIVHKGPKK